MDKQTVENIVAQIDHMKPDHLIPGVDIGMTVDGDVLIVNILPGARRVEIGYDIGADLYTAVVYADGKRTEFDSVFCDQLGELCFGEQAKPWTMPFFEITDWEGNPL